MAGRNGVDRSQALLNDGARMRLGAVRPGGRIACFRSRRGVVASRQIAPAPAPVGWPPGGERIRADLLEWVGHGDIAHSR